MARLLSIPSFEKYLEKKIRRKFSRKLRLLSQRYLFQASSRMTLDSPQTASPSRLTTRRGMYNRMGTVVVKDNKAMGANKIKNLQVNSSRASKSTAIKGWCLTRAPRGTTTTDRPRCTMKSCKETSSE